LHPAAAAGRPMQVATGWSDLAAFERELTGRIIR
jgi:hypothetical protein